MIIVVNRKCGLNNLCCLKHHEFRPHWVIQNQDNRVFSLLRLHFALYPCVHDKSKKSGTLWSQDDQSPHVSGCPDVSVECHRMLSTACGAWSAPLGEGGGWEILTAVITMFPNVGMMASLCEEQICQCNVTGSQDSWLVECQTCGRKVVSLGTSRCSGRIYSPFCADLFCVCSTPCYCRGM